MKFKKKPKLNFELQFLLKKNVNSNSFNDKQRPPL